MAAGDAGCVVCRACSIARRRKSSTRRGHRFCRYADDCNIYVRSRRAGERVMASMSRFLTNKLRLKVNEAKSAVARPEERKFLGFSISNDGSERRIAPNALDKFKTQVRDKTRRTRGISLPQLIEDLTRGPFTATPIWYQQRASRCWLIGRAEDRTYCKIVIIWRLSALDPVARNMSTPRRNFAV